jgi:uncharacterized protein (TIGR02594 family)
MNYSTWIKTLGPLPKLVQAALQYSGIKEVPGKSNNPAIMAMAKELGAGSIYPNDETSWCAVFINYLLKITGKPAVDLKGDPYNILRAKWLLNWGDPVKPGDEKLGDIGIFNRAGGGHVGIIIAETPNTFVIFGGNQGNSAGFTEILKGRLAGVRRYYAIGPPESAKKYLVDSSGQVSVNEA